MLRRLSSNILKDTHGRHHNYLRISLTEKCNFRCQYCMPKEGVTLTQKHHLLTLDEIFYLGKYFIQHGVTKIRLTGGEPLLSKDLLQIISFFKRTPGCELIGLTTNGLTLSKKLEDLKKSGLDLLNVSLDTLIPSKFEFITRRKGHENVIRGIYDALNFGYEKVKVNVVVMRGFNDDELVDFVEWTRDKRLDVRFIEYMPFDGNKWSNKKIVSYVEMLDIIRQKYPNMIKCEDGDDGTSKGYKVPGFEGSIGFISSMTNNFCGTCNRLRLTADGHLKVCLFGNSELDLKKIIREPIIDERLLHSMIETAVKRKKAQHAGMEAIKNMKNRPMIFIGG